MPSKSSSYWRTSPYAIVIFSDENACYIIEYYEDKKNVGDVKSNEPLLNIFMK